MAIVKTYNKARGVTYVYESHSYWDKELKQPRSTRKLIGKLDPDTGDIVPTGKKGRRKQEVQQSPGHSVTQHKQLQDPTSALIKIKDAEILELRKKLAVTEQELDAYKRLVKQAYTLFDKAMSNGR